MVGEISLEKWFIKNKKANYKELASKYGVSEFIMKLIVNRDIIGGKAIRTFIKPELENFHNSYDMKDIKRATDILKDKIKENKKIRIIGDYDVDGVISVYILYRSLKECNANVDYDIPDRIKDGYGININIMKKAKEEGVDTIITCDNGIAAIDTIEYGKMLGLTIIVTDHHDIPFVEKEDGKIEYISSVADAIINPKQQDCNYEFKNLCGAGVAFKLIESLFNQMNIEKIKCYNLIEFVAIATVCDVVDLIGENRIFVKNGIDMINKTSNIGLKALMKETGIEGKKVSTYHLGFVIGPSINASGRLDNAKRGVRLLLSNTEEEASILAKELFLLNEERKDMTKMGVERAIEIVKTTKIKKQKVFVIYIEDVHESLAGIIAGRIREKYNVPTIIITNSYEGAKGSGRSIEGYNMFLELLKCKSLFYKFGGHPMAAGLSLDINNIETLREELNKNTTLKDKDLIPKVTVDMPLPLDYINHELIYEIESLEPFGKGNTKPLFANKNLKIIKGDILGKKQNVLKLSIKSQNGKAFNGIYFGDIEKFEATIISKYKKSELENLYKGVPNNVYLDFIFYPSINEYNGYSNIQIVIESFR